MFIKPPANQPFSAWIDVFPDAAMTAAAVDRLVHHATIIEMSSFGIVPSVDELLSAR